MDIATFRRILTTFADTPADLDMGKGTLLAQVRDDVIEARLSLRQGDLFVTENEDSLPAATWLIQRIARLPLLADRILAHVPPEQTFVSPDGFLLDQIDEAPDDQQQYVTNAAEAAVSVLDRRPAGAASVLYLTSDAGEGKTTLIHHLARYQAQRYKEKTTDWLLVPVSLGGRTFMRFDDVIIGALMNRLRFNLLFYDAFVELVRLGVVVPALDGFEEMFVEGSSGDAISALGNLMQAMQSSGSVLIAARKAYFEFKNLRAQTRLFDSLGQQSVSFARLSLKRWDRERFLEYARKRKIATGEEVYEAVAGQLGNEHPLLTRAVLVRRLLDIATEEGERIQLLERICRDPADYFREFIGSIISREAQEKWIDKVGEPAQPLISEEEHYELLATIAFEMWANGTELIPSDVLEFAAEVFADSKRKDKVITHQVVERVKQHALLVRGESGKFAFDHPEFYHFFLGEAVGRMLVEGDAPALRHCFRQAVLPQLATESACRCIVRAGKSVSDVVTVTQRVFEGEPRMSVVKENLSGIVIQLIDLSGGRNVTVTSGSFPPDSLKGRRLENVTLSQSYFQASSLEGVTMTNCRFVECEFEGLDLRDSTQVNGVEFIDCVCRMVVPASSEVSVFSPEGIRDALMQAGVQIASTSEPDSPQERHPVEVEENVAVMERVVRAFMRSTGLNEKTLNRRLGAQAATFFREVLPSLLERGILEEVPFRGGGNQRRFRLGVRLEAISDALETCQGEFDRFLDLAAQ